MIGNNAWSTFLTLVSVVALVHCGSDDEGGAPSGNGPTGGSSGSEVVALLSSESSEAACSSSVLGAVDPVVASFS